MKSHLIVAVALALASGSAVAQRPYQPYGDGIDGPYVRAALDARWPTDEAVRRNMEDIRTAVNATVAVIHQSAVAPEHFVALGELVEGRIGRIASDAKLSPEADARLHAVLLRMFKAADALRQGGPGVENTAKMLQAMNDYALAFDHPGWQPQQPAQALSIFEAKRRAAQDVPGRVTRARADVRPGEPLHYHVDVRTDEGHLARLNVDARSALVTYRDSSSPD